MLAGHHKNLLLEIHPELRRARRSVVKDVGVESLLSFNVAIDQEFLDRPNIVPALKQMQGEAVA